MILEEIKNRRSVRSYQDKEIPKEVLLRILEAIRLAPSASNRQPWKFVVVQDKELIQKVAEASPLYGSPQTFIASAPVIIAGCATNPEHIMSNGVPSYPIDLAIALDHLTLQATKEGLGTCWIGAFDQNKVKILLGVPDTVKIVCLMPLGYPKDVVTAKKSRKPLENIICYNQYQE